MKGYWVVYVDVDDVEGYKAYQAANAEPIRKHGGRFLVRGMDHQVVEGKARSRLVIIEFPSVEAARDCYGSPEYSKARTIREGLSSADFVIAPGYENAQPVGPSPN